MSSISAVPDVQVLANHIGGALAMGLTHTALQQAARDEAVVLRRASASMPGALHSAITLVGPDGPGPVARSA